MTTPPALDRILGEGRQAHVAVVSPKGPHVTPELYAWSGGQLWFWFARTTLKARVLAQRPEAAALVTVGDRTAILDGTVDLVDVHRPRTLVGSPARGLRAARAAGGYALRNAADLTAFARDLGTGRLGWRPPPAGGEQVVVALPGPAAIPGRWYAEEARVRVDPLLLDAFGVEDETPLAVVADEYVAPGPAAKVGTLLRGTAVRRGPGELHLAADLLTSWDGIETETHHAADAGA